MVLSCLGLLYMQMDYINAIGRMRREHFDEGVKPLTRCSAYVDHITAKLCYEFFKVRYIIRISVKAVRFVRRNNLWA